MNSEWRYWNTYPVRATVVVSQVVEGNVVDWSLQAYRMEFRFFPGGAGRVLGDGYGDISDGSHGQVLQKCSGNSLYLKCAPEADNYQQSAHRKIRGLPTGIRDQKMPAG
jgi:hypothetical protein